MTRVRGVLRIVVPALAAAAVLAFGTTVVLGKDKDVARTTHNVAAPGVSPCSLCHIPRDPLGEVLWAQPTNSTGSFAGIRPLCFSCHDGTVTAVGAYVFDPTTPTHLSNPAVRGADCDRCHDPHETGFGKFLKYGRGANICQNCHTRAGPSDHPVNVNATARGIVPKDSAFDPYKGDFSGTRLWDIEGTGPGDLVKCMSCHAPHGGAPGTALSSIAFTESGHQSFLPLCVNCHYKWGDTATAGLGR